MHEKGMNRVKASFELTIITIKNGMGRAEPSQHKGVLVELLEISTYISVLSSASCLLISPVFSISRLKAFIDERTSQSRSARLLDFTRYELLHRRDDGTY